MQGMNPIELISKSGRNPSVVQSVGVDNRSQHLSIDPSVLNRNDLV